MRHFCVMGSWFRKKSSKRPGIELGPQFPSDIGAKDSVAFLSAFSYPWSGSLDQVPLKPVSLRLSLLNRSRLRGQNSSLNLLPSLCLVLLPPASMSFLLQFIYLWMCSSPSQKLFHLIRALFLLIPSPNPGSYLKTFAVSTLSYSMFFKTHSPFQ